MKTKNHIEKSLKKSKSGRRYVYSVDREVNCFLRNNRDSDRNDDASNRFSWDDSNALSRNGKQYYRQGSKKIKKRGCSRSVNVTKCVSKFIPKLLL